MERRASMLRISTIAEVMAGDWHRAGRTLPGRP